VHEGIGGIKLSIKRHVKRTVNTDAEYGEYDGMKVEMLFTNLFLIYPSVAQMW
jgi:hypothetical protein